MDGMKLCLITFIFCNAIIFAKAEFPLSKNSTHCPELLKGLAETQHLYVQCSTKHAVPVKLCTACEPQYKDMHLAYEKIRENCTNEYFNHDRINVVETTQNMLKSLWDKAFCDDCFSSNNSETFTDLNADFESCLNKHKTKEEKCAVCVREYSVLNSFYVSIDEHNNGKVCFDLQDAMNTTRLLWSKTLNCCPRELRMTWFTVAVLCFGFTPFVFYIGAIILTKHRERTNPYVHITNETTSNDLQQPVRPDLVSVAHQSERPQTSVNKPVRILESDSDDDESLPRMQKLT